MESLKIFEFLPYFKKVSFTDDAYCWVNEDSNFTTCFDSKVCRLDSEVEQFIDTFKNCKLYDSDFELTLKNYFKDKPLRNVTKEEIESAPLEISVAFLSKIIYQNKFIEGLIADSIKDGKILFLLNQIYLKSEKRKVDCA